MSVFGYFACMDCKVVLWLGKAVRADADFKQINYFDNLIYPDSTPAALREWQLQYTYALCKMLAEHARHTLRVIIEGDPEEDLLGDGSEYIQIGGHRNKDIDLEPYLKDWPIRSPT